MYAFVLENHPIWVAEPLPMLSSEQVYKLFKLRQQVFVVEQNCAYSDIDDWDWQATHLLMQIHQNLAACARILPPNTKFKNPSIGRVAVDATFRSRGYGKIIMQKAIFEAQTLFPNCPIYISAQAHLERFYAHLGFITCSAVYEEDHIPHIDMYLPQ